MLYNCDYTNGQTTLQRNLHIVFEWREVFTLQLWEILSSVDSSAFETVCNNIIFGYELLQQYYIFPFSTTYFPERPAYDLLHTLHTLCCLSIHTPGSVCLYSDVQYVQSDLFTTSPSVPHFTRLYNHFAVVTVTVTG